MTDYSAIGKRSKRKGKTYERRTAKLLTEFTGVGFRKTPSSGGFNRFGGVSIREELFCGDVISDSHDFRFCVEAKNREEFTFEGILKNPNTAPFTLWWYQCCDDAKRVGLKPILFFKPDNQADFIAVNALDFKDGLKKVKRLSLNVYDGSLLTLKIRDGKSIDLVETTLVDPCIINWKDFVKAYGPEVMFNGMLR